jgi:hypothetical protein
MISIEKFGFMQCPECERVFDLDKEDEANEWHYGHDCFLEEEMTDNGKL